MQVFEILIYAIAALALLIIFFELVLPFFAPGNNLDTIKNSLANSLTQKNLGKTIDAGNLRFGGGSTISSSDFDKTKMLVAMECISPNDCCQKNGETTDKCTKAISWDDTFFTANQTKNINTYTRCTLYQNTPLCKVFVGAAPAQAKITGTIAAADASGETQIKVTLTNTGTLPIVSGTNSVELYKKGANGWIKTDYLMEAKSTPTIMPGGKSTIDWMLTPTNTGEYEARFTFEATEAGFDEKNADFNKTTNSACAATTTGDTLFDPDTNAYREMRQCSGCNYAYECAVAWNTKEPQTQFYPDSKDAAYCAKQSMEGTC